MTRLAKSLTDEQRERLKNRIGDYPYLLFSRMSGKDQVEGYKALMQGEVLCNGSWGFAICLDETRKIPSYYRMPKMGFMASAMPKDQFFLGDPALVECPNGPGWDDSDFTKSVRSIVENQNPKTILDDGLGAKDIHEDRASINVDGDSFIKPHETAISQDGLIESSSKSGIVIKENNVKSRKPSEKPAKVWKQVVSVRLNQWQIEALEKEADGEAVGMIIRKAVREYLRARGYNE